MSDHAVGNTAPFHVPLSHKKIEKEAPLDLSAHQERLKNTSDLTLPLPETLDLLDQLAQFDAGKFLLTHQGLNGYWTSYVILEGPLKASLSPLEDWMLHHAPIVRSTRERFHIFQREIQKRMRSHMTLLSVPCGLMDDCLTLDFKGVHDVQITGIDIDGDSLALAHKSAETKGISNVLFYQEDAWALKTTETYDLITSNGLNIYEPDPARVMALYRILYQALRPGGTLVTSFLTSPPFLSRESSWKNFNPQDLLKQRALFKDIIQAQWQNFQTEDQVRTQLEEIGFHALEFIYDRQGMFPTVVALKESLPFP